MEELKDKYIRFDWAIKRLLRQKANFGVLEGFLTVFIGEPQRMKMSEIIFLGCLTAGHGTNCIKENILIE